jgi:D-3-phosphoglycerate dehydrogenase/(S)-sulfolactate dehydrogenase
LRTPQAVDVVVLEGVWGRALETLPKEMRVRQARTGDTSSDIGLLALVGSAHALVVRNRTRVDRTLLEAAPALRVVARAGVGLDNIDVQAADDLGIVVIAAQGANATSVGELAIAFGLALARGIPWRDRDTRAGGWDRTQGVELAGRTWGVLGLGATGIETARLARAFQMRVVGYDPYVQPDRADLVDLGVEVMSLEAVREVADVISVHMPLTGETRGSIDSTFLDQMKSGAFLINVARGEIVDETALADALEKGHIGGAALDVRTSEPPVVGRLESLDRLILTPHIAGLTDSAQERIVESLAADLKLLFSGGESPRAVGVVRRIR